MEKRSLESYERSYLILIALIIIEIFLIYLNVYLTQAFPLENFTVIIVQLIAISLSYFFGILMAAVFSIVYVAGYIVYVINSGYNLNLVSYILLFFVPLTIVFAGNMNKNRKRIFSDLERLEKLEETYVRIDPYTLLENELAFKEVLSKHNNLAKRYGDYFFSVHIFRLEFIGTLRTILDVKGFNKLMKDIADIIQKGIRHEDYKFILSKDRFAIIAPLTSRKSIGPAIGRILENVGRLNVVDRDLEKVSVVLKTGSVDYSKDKEDIFEDYEKLLLELQRATEVDIYGEYYN